jgi:2'-5' RNA ligase
MRLFIGIFPDEELKNYLRDVIGKMNHFNQLRFAQLEQIHLTVKFLGNDISEGTYHDYSVLFEQKIQGFNKFTVIPTDVSFGFKFQIRPKVMILNVEESVELDQLTQIAADTAKIIPQSDIISTKEHKKLVHHITIARPKRVPSKSEGRRIRTLVEAIEPYNKPFPVHNVSLIQSILTAQGPIYKNLKTINLR